MWLQDIGRCYGLVIDMLVHEIQLSNRSPSFI
jgi:tetrahydromethanopterin S-methyltransferase subunit G